MIFCYLSAGKKHVVSPERSNSDSIMHKIGISTMENALDSSRLIDDKDGDIAMVALRNKQMQSLLQNQSQTSPHQYALNQPAFNSK